MFETQKNYIVNSGDAWFVGKFVGTVPFGVVLDQCAWVAATGRFHEFMRDGKTKNMEIEMWGDGCTIRWDAYQEWKHDLFTESI